MTNIVPISRAQDAADNRDEFQGAIDHWINARNAADALSREEIGAMNGFQRLDAQRKALIIGLAQYFRKHERSDVAPGVAVVMTLLSDNEDGCSHISQETLAKLFGRFPSSIREAQKRLKDDGLIVMGRGRYAASHPVIPRAVTASYNHLTWLVGALCNHEQPINVPVAPADCQSADHPGGLTQTADRPGGLEQLNPPVEDVSIRGATGAYFSIRILLHWTLQARTVAAMAGNATRLQELRRQSQALPLRYRRWQQQQPCQPTHRPSSSP